MDEDAVGDVLWLIRGAWVTMAVRAGCRLGVFDLLGEPRDPASLAGATGSDPHSLARLLRVLAWLGLVEERDGGTYADTARGATLAQGHPSNLRSLALMQSRLPNIAAWNHLDDAVRSGGGVYERVNGREYWEHLSAQPDELALFNQSMARRADSQVAAIVSGIDLGSAHTVVDVGGGRGAMLAGVLGAWPHLTGVVADRPDVAAEAEAAFADQGLGDRARGVGCDFMESVPGGADVYFLANVLHDWDDADCRRILTTIRAATGAGARLLVLEHVLDAPGRSDAEARDLAFVDLHMLVAFGARERTQEQYDALLTTAGFAASRLVSGTGDWNVLECRPAT